MKRLIEDQGCNRRVKTHVNEMTMLQQKGKNVHSLCLHVMNSVRYKMTCLSVTNDCPTLFPVFFSNFFKGRREATILILAAVDQ